jgi:hypothetical protein
MRLAAAIERYDEGLFGHYVVIEEGRFRAVDCGTQHSRKENKNGWSGNDTHQLHFPEVMGSLKGSTHHSSTIEGGYSAASLAPPLFRGLPSAFFNTGARNFPV